MEEEEGRRVGQRNAMAEEAEEIQTVKMEEEDENQGMRVGTGLNPCPARTSRPQSDS